MIDSPALERGHLNHRGTLRVDRIYALAQALIVKRFGKVNSAVLVHVAISCKSWSRASRGRVGFDFSAPICANRSMWRRRPPDAVGGLSLAPGPQSLIPPMICVSIGRGRHRHVIAEHRHLVEQGAKLVELRLDYINGEANIKRLVADRPCPVVITCRRPADGGKFAGSEEQRLMLLRTAIAEGVEYVDLEDDVAGKIPRFGQTKRIVSLHDFRKTPDNLEEIHRGSAAWTPDIVKICTMANHPRDNLRMLQLSRRARSPPSASAWATSACPPGSSADASARPSPSPPSITSGRWRRANSASSR